MDASEMLSVASLCAKTYDKNLARHNMLFIYGDVSKPKYFEASFLPRIFLHLTGLRLLKVNKNQSTAFYVRLLTGKISKYDIAYDSKGIAEVKLSVLEQLMNIGTTAQIIGEYNGSKPLLYTEIITGNAQACMGFVLENNGYYVPNTVLKINPRKIVTKRNNILCIFRKQHKDDYYQEICQIAEGLTLNDINLPDEIKSKILMNSTK